MTFSQRRTLNDPELFDTPPLWLVWVGDDRWNADQGCAIGWENYEQAKRTHKGPVRHMATLAKAKKYVTPYGRRGRPGSEVVFFSDWAIYEWVGGEYVKRYEGEAGGRLDRHPLFERGVVSNKPVPVSDKLVQKAIASIQKAS